MLRRLHPRMYRDLQREERGPFVPTLTLIGGLTSAMLLASVANIAQAQPNASTENTTENQSAAPARTPASRLQTGVYPLDGVTTPSGNTLIVDRNLPGIWNYNNDKLEVLTQGSKQFRQPLNAVRAIAVSPAGKIYVGDSATREIYEVLADGSTKPLTNGLIGVPVDLAVASDETLYIADLERRAVWRWKPGSDNKPEVFLEKANARGLAVDSQDQLWVLSQNSEQLLRYDSSGKETKVVESRTFQFPNNVAVDKSGTAWVSDGYAKAVWKIAPGAAPEKAIESDLFQNPVGLFWVNEELAVVDPHAMKVFVVDAQNSVREWITISDPK